MDTLPSKLLENAVNEFATLPGIGRKTALRLALHLLRQDTEQVQKFGQAVIAMKEEIKLCKCCKNISDEEICEICSSVSRDKHTVCIVESVKDVMSIERTGQYAGVYHVLGGTISPMEGIGPYLEKLEVLAPSFAIAIFFGWMFSKIYPAKKEVSNREIN